MTQLFWQPPPVTKCDGCLYTYFTPITGTIYCSKASYDARFTLIAQNKDSITESCPMWQQQKASLDANKEVK